MGSFFIKNSAAKHYKMRLVIFPAHQQLFVFYYYPCNLIMHFHFKLSRQNQNSFFLAVVSFFPASLSGFAYYTLYRLTALFFHSSRYLQLKTNLMNCQLTLQMMIKILSPRYQNLKNCHLTRQEFEKRQHTRCCY